MKFNIDYHHQKKFINLDMVNTLNDRFYDIQTNKTYLSIHDNNIVELTAEEVNQEVIFNSLNKFIQKYFRENVGLKNLQLKKLWLVSTKQKDVNPFKLPYVPHFDKLRYFKAMVYLHTVTKDHGPIHLAKVKNPIDIENRRKKLPDNYQNLGLNIVKEHDLIEPLNPLTGNAGDVVFFDTNISHKAGILTNGFERRVLRFDFELPGHNPKPSFVRRILKKIFPRKQNVKDTTL